MTATTGVRPRALFRTACSTLALLACTTSGAGAATVDAPPLRSLSTAITTDIGRGAGGRFDASCDDGVSFDADGGGMGTLRALPGGGFPLAYEKQAPTAPDGRIDNLGICPPSSALERPRPEAAPPPELTEAV